MTGDTKRTSRSRSRSRSRRGRKTLPLPPSADQSDKCSSLPNSDDVGVVNGNNWNDRGLSSNGNSAFSKFVPEHNSSKRNSQREASSLPTSAPCSAETDRTHDTHGHNDHDDHGYSGGTGGEEENENEEFYYYSSDGGIVSGVTATAAAPPTAATSDQERDRTDGLYATLQQQQRRRRRQQRKRRQNRRQQLLSSKVSTFSSSGEEGGEGDKDDRFYDVALNLNHQTSRTETVPPNEAFNRALMRSYSDGDNEDEDDDDNADEESLLMMEVDEEDDASYFYDEYDDYDMLQLDIEMMKPTKREGKVRYGRQARIHLTVVMCLLLAFIIAGGVWIHLREDPSEDNGPPKLGSIPTIPTITATTPTTDNDADSTTKSVEDNPRAPHNPPLRPVRRLMDQPLGGGRI